MPVLTLSVQAIPNSGSAPLTVYFAAFVSGGTPPYSFEWTFGDGTQPSYLQNTLHSYATGTFDANCTATDTNGFQAESGPIPITVSAAIPNATYTPLSGQVCVAAAPAPLVAMPSGPALEAIPAGAEVEQLVAVDYYDRCLGEFIGQVGVQIPVVVTSVSNSDGTLYALPTTGDVVVSLNTGKANSWAAPQTFGLGITGTGTIGTLGLGSTALGTGYTWSAVQTFGAGITGTGTIGTLGLGSTALNTGYTWGAVQSFSAGITGSGTIGNLVLGSNAQAQQYTWTSVQQFTAALEALSLINFLAGTTHGNSQTIAEIYNSGQILFATNSAGRLVIDPSNLFGGILAAHQIVDDGSGNVQFGAGSAAVTMTINSGASPSGLHVVLPVAGGGLQFLDSGNSNAAAMVLSNAVFSIASGYTLNVAATSNTSDSRLKSDFTVYPGDPLVELSSVRLGQYRTFMGRDMGSWRAGVAAETLPEFVRERLPDGYYAVKHPDFEAWLAMVSRALFDRIRALEDRLDSLGKLS